MADRTQRIETGIGGLDEILGGGLVASRAYLVRGGPGTGKTTFGAQILKAAHQRGAKTLLITLEESASNLRSNAASSGIDLSSIPILDLSPASQFFTESEMYDIFSVADVEREPTTQSIVAKVRDVEPEVVFLDPLSQFRYFASDVYLYRKQVLSFLRFLTELGATVIFTSEGSAEAPDDDLQYMADGVINLDVTTDGRSVAISKNRGSAFIAGPHSMKISNKGIQVFPRLRPIGRTVDYGGKLLASGIAELDELLHGGIPRGSIALLSGPGGVGKTTLGIQFMKEAAGRGERSIIFSFEEEIDMMLRRCDAINIPARAMIEQGSLVFKKIDPFVYDAAEFSYVVRDEVERHKADIVMLDSVVGFRMSVRGHDAGPTVHAMCKYLTDQGATVVLIDDTQTVTGNFAIASIGISYMADLVLFLRYLEVIEQRTVYVRRSIGVLRSRLGTFESTLREYSLTANGIKVSEPLHGLSTILGELPVWDKDRAKDPKHANENQSDGPSARR